MMNIGFDNEKYLQMQSAHIRERIAQFDNKLYLEFGGNYLMTSMHLVYSQDSSRILRCVC